MYEEWKKESDLKVPLQFLLLRKHPKEMGRDCKIINKKEK